LEQTKTRVKQRIVVGDHQGSIARDDRSASAISENELE